MRDGAIPILVRRYMWLDQLMPSKAALRTGQSKLGYDSFRACNISVIVLLSYLHAVLSCGGKTAAWIVASRRTAAHIVARFSLAC
jgi:hypothetical protein